MHRGEAGREARPQAAGETENVSMKQSEARTSAHPFDRAFSILFFFPTKRFAAPLLWRGCVAKLRGWGCLGRGHVTQTAPWGRRTGPVGPGPAGSWCWCTWARWRAAADRGAAAGRWREGGPEQAGSRGRVPCWRRADSSCTQPGSTPPLDASQSPVRKVGNKKVKRREEERQWQCRLSRGSLQLPTRFPHEASTLRNARYANRFPF